VSAAPDCALSACPFCGSTNIDPKGWASTNSAGPACDDCGASAGNVSNALADNIAAWNRRAEAALLDSTAEFEGWKQAAHWRQKAEALTSAARGYQEELEALRRALRLREAGNWVAIESAPEEEDVLVHLRGAAIPFRVAMLCPRGDERVWLDAQCNPLSSMFTPTHWHPLSPPTTDDLSVSASGAQP